MNQSLTVMSSESSVVNEGFRIELSRQCCFNEVQNAADEGTKLDSLGFVPEGL